MSTISNPQSPTTRLIAHAGKVRAGLALVALALPLAAYVLAIGFQWLFADGSSSIIAAYLMFAVMFATVPTAVIAAVLILDVIFVLLLARMGASGEPHFNQWAILFDLAVVAMCIPLVLASPLLVIVFPNFPPHRQQASYPPEPQIKGVAPLVMHKHARGEVHLPANEAGNGRPGKVAGDKATRVGCGDMPAKTARDASCDDRLGDD